MNRYNVPVTITATITVVSPDAGSARNEARRYAEALDGDSHFRDGWNDMCRREARPTIEDVTGFDVEAIDLADIERLPARWFVVPQRDHNSALPGDETDVRECSEAEATSWGVFERDFAFQHPAAELVEDYPSREQADAAVKALENGEELPEPQWPAASSDLNVFGVMIGRGENPAGLLISQTFATYEEAETAAASHRTALGHWATVLQIVAAGAIVSAEGR